MSSRSLWPVIVGLGVLIVVAVGGYFALRYLLDWWGSLDRVLALFIVGVITLLGSAQVVARAIRAAGLLGATESLHRKAEAYCRLLERWTTTTADARGVRGGCPPQADLHSLEVALALWGGHRVLVQYDAFRKEAMARGSRCRELLERLLLEMRADLGHHDPALSSDLFQDLFGQHTPERR